MPAHPAIVQTHRRGRAVGYAGRRLGYEVILRTIWRPPREPCRRSIPEAADNGPFPDLVGTTGTFAGQGRHTQLALLARNQM